MLQLDHSPITKLQVYAPKDKKSLKRLMMQDAHCKLQGYTLKDDFVGFICKAIKKKKRVLPLLGYHKLSAYEIVCTFFFLSYKLLSYTVHFDFVNR